MDKKGRQLKQIGRRKWRYGDNVYFNSKKQVTDKARDVLHRHGVGEVLRGPDAEFIMALATFREDSGRKFAPGIKHIEVHDGRYNSKGFQAELTDGRKEPFSFNKFDRVDGQVYESDIKNAFRVAVEPDVRRFKMGAFEPFGKALCPVSSVIITPGNAHVDHEPPWTFAHILATFLQVQDLRVPDIEVRTGEDGMAKELVDQEFAKKWVAFHNEHARLRVVAAKANLSEVRKETTAVELFQQNTQLLLYLLANNCLPLGKIDQAIQDVVEASGTMDNRHLSTIAAEWVNKLMPRAETGEDCDEGRL